MADATPCPKKRILLCVDGSKYSEKAFYFYKEIMHKHDHILEVLHVSDCVKIPYSHSIGLSFNLQVFPNLTGNPSKEAAKRAELEEAMAQLKRDNLVLQEKYIKMCEDNNIEHKVMILSGNEGVDHTIINYMENNEGLTAVVLGTKGKGNLKRKLLGSVSHHIMHHSHVPVVLCPHEDDHQYN